MDTNINNLMFRKFNNDNKCWQFMFFIYLTAKREMKLSTLNCIIKL